MTHFWELFFGRTWCEIKNVANGTVVCSAVNSVWTSNTVTALFHSKNSHCTNLMLSSPNSCSNRYGRDQNQLWSKQESNPPCLGNNLLITFKNLRRLMERNLRRWSGDNGRQCSESVSGFSDQVQKMPEEEAAPRQRLVCLRDSVDRKRMKRKLLSRLFPNLFLSHSHQKKSLRQEKYISFYLIAKTRAKHSLK